MSGADDVHARTHLQNLSAYRESDALHAGDIGGMSQEEILDLIVAATIGQEEPLDDEPADGDYWDPDDLLGLRRDGANPPRAPAGGSVSPGSGFASDGILDGLVPGPALAGLADTAHSRGLHLVSDDELTGIIRAWRRITSWATARELAAIAELARRRPADDTDFGLQIKARLRAAGAAGAAEEDKARERCSGDGASAVGERECSAGSAPANGGPVGLPGGSGKPGDEPPRAAETERSADETPGPDAGFPALISPFVSDELAAALTLTVRAAETHLEFATELASKLLMTAAALEAGVIDPVRAKIIADAAHVLTNEQAAAVEDLILPRAGQQTSGQLWAALARAILAADPDAARRRREEAQRDARVMRWREDAGTAALCGRDLPSTDVLAADQRISARARELKSAGIAGTMDELRARAYLDFLLGRSTMPEGSAGDCQAVPPSSGGSTSAGHGPAPARADGTATGLEATAGPAGGLAAQINVTVPLSAILGLSEAPAEVAAFGPVDAPLARDLVRAAGIHPATRWCVTVVGQNGQAVGHGCARGRYTAPAAPAAPAASFPGNHDLPGDADDGLSSAGDNGRPGDNRRNRDGPRGSTSAPEPQLHALSVRAREFMRRLGIRVTPLAVATCDHRNEEPGYKPSRRLRHLTGARTARCTAPGCRRPAVQCDFDHTIAYEAGGRTCECNLGPLCRRHHRCKQAQGWALEQPSPGIMIWTTPAGRRYTTRPTSYYI